MFGGFTSGFGDLSKLTNALNFDDLQVDLDPSLLTPEQLAKAEAEKKAKAKRDEAARIAKLEAAKAEAEDTTHEPSQESGGSGGGGGGGGDDWDDWGDEPKPTTVKAKKADPKKAPTPQKAETQPAATKPPVKGEVPKTKPEATAAPAASKGFFGFVSDSNLLQGSGLLQRGPFSLDSLQADDNDDDDGDNTTATLSQTAPLQQSSSGDHETVNALRRELEELKWSANAETEQRQKFQEMVRTYANDMVKEKPLSLSLSLSTPPFFCTVVF
jgi:outer membrane biosynthesis protein TonB